MIVPRLDAGFPPAVASAATAQVYAAVTAPEPFEVMFNTARCLVMVPLGAGRLEFNAPDLKQGEAVTKPFVLAYLPTGRERHIIQKRGVEHLFLSIAADRMVAVMGSAARKLVQRPSCVVGYAHPDIPAVAQALRRHMLDPRCANSVYLNAQADILLAHAMAAFGSRPANPAGPTPFRNDLLQSILSQVEKQLEEGVSIAALASAFQMTPSEFSRRFKVTVGCSPQRYIIEKRIAEARRLLRESDEPIAEIAFRLGYSSQAHLTSSFKSLMGLTPSRYRKRNR